MQFKFIISKWANFYFFIQNLSEWHFSCRPIYNQEWLKQTGPLIEKEKTALNNFREIIKNYGFSYKKGGKSKYLGQIFFLNSEKKIWKKLKKFVSSSEFKKLREIFEIFEPRFNKIWDRYSNNLRRVEIFKKRLQRKNWKKLWKDLEIVLGGKKKIRKINIIVILAPLGHQETASGSANIGTKHITLELPDLKENTWQLDYSIGILAHEIGHILFRMNGGEKMIEKMMKQSKLPGKIKHFNFSVSGAIRELIIESFVPKGCLGQIYSDYKLAPMLLANLDKGLESARKFKNKEVISYYNQLNIYLLWQIYPLALSYFKNKKPIDKYFILEIGKLIKSLKKNY